MENKETNLENLQKAAEEKDPTALYRLGKAYYYGELGLVMDKKLGLDLIIRAGKLGLKEAQKKAIQLVPSGSFDVDADLNQWLHDYDPSEYDRLCEIHQMML